MSTYDELAARAERDELPIKEGRLRRRAAARSAGRTALLEATGVDDLREVVRIALSPT
ncbi:hypothetical protein GCM10009596_11450 [Arthrobacter rhombi]|uniref:hypothetical protein n=1 Tax=Arthrobacter rhombi TaxID=71253 RepID=UPI0031CDBB2D